MPDPSQTVAVRLPKSIFDIVKENAILEDRTVSMYVRRLIEKEIARKPECLTLPTTPHAPVPGAGAPDKKGWGA